MMYSGTEDGVVCAFNHELDQCFDQIKLHNCVLNTGIKFGKYIHNIHKMFGSALNVLIISNIAVKSEYIDQH